MRNINWNILLLAVLLVGAACKKEYVVGPQEPPKPPPVDKLPAITTTGKNTFGCLVNDVVYISTPQTIAGKQTLQAELDTAFSEMLLSSIQTNMPNGAMWLGIVNFTGTGKYDLPYSYGLYHLFTTDSYTVYRPNTDTTNIIEVTRFDSLQKIVSGKFTLNFKNVQTNEKLTIKSGRFDLKYTFYKN